MPSRREQIQLSEREIRRYLDQQPTVIIVSNGPDGFPHPMPMWFFVDDDASICCTTFRKSQKVLNLQRDPKAALLVESGSEYAELKSVLIYATCEIIDDVDAVRNGLERIRARGKNGVSENQGSTMLDTAPKRVLLKFTPVRYVSWDHAKLEGRY